MRVIALLLAVVMIAGAATQVVWVSPDATSEVDDELALDTLLVSEPVAIPLPDRREAVPIDAPSPDRGRMHAVQLFRPPRVVASR